MPLDIKKLKKSLIEKGLVNTQDFDVFAAKAAKEKKGVTDLLLAENIVSEEDLAQELSSQTKIPFADLSKTLIRKDILFQIPELIAKKHEIIAFNEDEAGLKVAMTNPEDLQTIEFIKKKVNKNIEPHVTSKAAIFSVLKQYRRGLRQEFKDIIDQSLAASRTAKQEDLAKLAENMPIVRIVNTLIEHAILQNASDIHIEPLEKNVIVRYRVDGILHDVIVLPKEIIAGIVARIKVLSNLKIDEHRLPQDGRFKTEKDEQKISFRVSIIPVFDGEKVVMRLLVESGRILTLEELGFQRSALKIAKRNIKKPNGLILVTGPTGSGKTTTLYSIMNMLNTTEVNIATIEDPVEYRMPRINQSQVKPKIGFTFSTGLRSLVRQDPDVIMVGEIRDEETADMAIHSALTGHLVLSTLHTMSAAGAAPRLIDMKAKPFLVASTLNIVIAQRLARRICKNCSEKYQLEEKTVAMLEKEFNMGKIMEVVLKEKVIAEKKPLGELTFYRGKGCEHCNMQGYKGRTGIYEALAVTDSIKELIVDCVPTEKIQAKAMEDGMISMIQDGFIKALSGFTTIDEILRVTKE
ncbi:MAG: type II/IV secretion system protein [Parcubacteria group bacterium]|nr:type II/IV secretion system protein [Parcubacteria group bacterium]